LELSGPKGVMCLAYIFHGCNIIFRIVCFR
jgi:hypothetical protein